MRLWLFAVFLHERAFSLFEEAPKSSLGLTLGLPGKIFPLPCALLDQLSSESSAIPVPSLCKALYIRTSLHWLESSNSKYFSRVSIAEVIIEAQMYANLL